MGERIIYEVSLENRGDEVLLLPWEPDREKIQPDHIGSQSGLLEVSVFISLIFDQKRTTVLPGVEGVYGSPSLPESIKELLPGQKVRIRSSGLWYVGDADLYQRIMPQLPRAYSVRAEYWLKDSTGHRTKNYEPVLSNSLTVELTRRDN